MKCNHTYSYKGGRGGLHTHTRARTQTRDGDVNTEAEVRVMQLQAKGCPRLPEAGRVKGLTVEGEWPCQCGPGWLSPRFHPNGADFRLLASGLVRRYVSLVLSL